MIHVACGIMYNNHNNVLMGQRNSSGPYPTIWEFPGGKLEEDETLEECLHREWMEELNLNIIIDKYLTKTTNKNITCHFFVGRIININDIVMNVHKEIGFYAPLEMKNLSLFEGDCKIVDLLG